MQYILVLYNILQYKTMQHNAKQCSTTQHNTTYRHNRNKTKHNKPVWGNIRRATKALYTCCTRRTHRPSEFNSLNLKTYKTKNTHRPTCTSSTLVELRRQTAAWRRQRFSVMACVSLYFITTFLESKKHPGWVGLGWVELEYRREGGREGEGTKGRRRRKKSTKRSSVIYLLYLPSRS